MAALSFEKLTPLLVAGIGAFGIASGYVYQKDKEMDADLRKTKQEIYVAFLNTLDIERMLAGRKTDKARHQLSAEDQGLSDKWNLERGAATNRLAIFGETAVIEALAEDWRLLAPPCSDDRWKLEVAFFRAMRDSVMPTEKRVSDAAFAELILRCTPNPVGGARPLR